MATRFASKMDHQVTLVFCIAGKPATTIFPRATLARVTKVLIISAEFKFVIVLKDIGRPESTCFRPHT